MATIQSNQPTREFRLSGVTVTVDDPDLAVSSGETWALRLYERDHLNADDLIGSFSLGRPSEDLTWTSEETLRFTDLDFSEPFEDDPELAFRIYREGPSGVDPEAPLYSTKPADFQVPQTADTRRSVALDLYSGKGRGHVVKGGVEVSIEWRAASGPGTGEDAMTTLAEVRPVTVNDVQGFDVRVEPGVFDSLSASRQNVVLGRAGQEPTPDQALWAAIRAQSLALSFEAYSDFIDRLLCAEGTGHAISGRAPSRDADQTLARRRGAVGLGNVYMSNADAYAFLKVATDVFLLLNCDTALLREGYADYDPAEEATRLGDEVPLDEIQRRLEAFLGGGKLPYIQHILETSFNGVPRVRSPYCYGVLESRTEPCMMELIWSYWHEEGMLVQTLNAISMRFQNRRGAGTRDPLANFALDPLRSMSSLMWGHIQDEQHRLSVVRRAYEYDHQYGLRLVGKAVPPLQSAESRAKFVEAFHNLLNRTYRFYQEDDDTTVFANGFPLLNALREVHMLLAEGAHNQVFDLTWTARSEMMVMEWMLSREEIRSYLGTRPMIPYREGWMAQVDSMKRLQGWTDTSVSHFRDLGVFGEQLLLSIRFGDWVNTLNQASAENWARYWRQEIQAYTHAYQAVTGVDLSADVVSAKQAERRDVIPAHHIQRRLKQQRKRPPQLQPAASRQELPARQQTWTNGHG